MFRIIILLLSFSTHLFANENLIQNTVNEKEVFKTTMSYLIESDRLDDAKLLAEKHIKSHPNDHDFHRYLGLVLYLKKDYENAIESFKKSEKLSTGSDKASCLYLIAQSNIKLGRIEDAKNQLEAMEKIPESKDYASVAMDSLKRSGEIPEYIPPSKMMSNTSSSSISNSGNSGVAKGPFSISANGVYGLDSNPIFIPDFSQEKNDAESSFYSLTANVGVNSNLSAGKLNNTLTAGYTSYSEEIAKSFNNFRLSLGTQFDQKEGIFNKWGITLLNKLDRSYQAQENLEYYFTSDVFSLKKDLFKNSNHIITGQANLGFRTYANKNLVNKEDDRSGASYGLRGIYKFSYDDFAIINSLGMTDQQTYGNKFDTMATDFGANVQKILYWDIEAMLGASVTRIDYVNSDENRIDFMTSYGLDLTKSIDQISGSSVKLSYSRTSNNSDLTASTYTQNIYSLWVNYDY